MRILIICFTSLLISINTIAQNSVKDFVKEGIQYHDNGNYEKAIEIYKKALELDPKSSLVHYEIALSYFSLKNYEKTIEYSDMILKQKSDYMLQAYLTKGSALDLQGKTNQSIKLFEKAVKQTGGHYLLHYNLGLNYYKIGELGKSEENVIKAIALKPTHSSSHLMLANIHDQNGNNVQTLLAVHYFLFLEPNSKRSTEAYQILQNHFGANVSKDPDDPNNINILLSVNKNTQFGAADLMISMLEASKSLEKNKGKTDDEMFVENTKSFFSILGELKKEKNKDIWWSFYTPFFYKIAKSEHLETYTKYISQSGNKHSKKWLTENQTKLKDFDTWLKKN